MRLVCPDDFSWVAPLERPVAEGEVVDVDDELGAALVLQGWTSERKVVRSSTAPTAAPDKE